MKREFLEKLGLDKENIDAIMAEHGKDVEANKSKIAEIENTNKVLESNLAERDSQLEKLSKSTGDATALQAEIEKLKADNQAAAEKHLQEVKEIKINNALQSALLEAKARNTKSVEAHIDRSKLQLQDDGSISGLAEQIKSLTENENTKFLFGEVQPQVRGVSPITTPAATPAASEADMDTWRKEAGL